MYFFVYFMVFVWIWGASSSVAPEQRLGQLAAAWSALFETPTTDNPNKCQGCGERRAAVEDTMASSQLTAMRIEYIKQQILKKLRLKEPPTISRPLSSLPKPLATGTVLSKTRGVPTVNKDVDDFYGRTDQVIIFPKEDNVRCVPAAQNPSACFLFQLPFELEPDDLTTVELWIYKERDRLDQHNQTFVVSEVAHWDINHSTQETKLLTIKDTNVKEGWVKIDLAWVVKNWLEYQELIHAIFIECKSCANEVARSPISLQPDRKPFLIIRTSSVNKRRRSKRHVNCVPGVSECCRENLYISFEEIGWDDWILHPTGYQAYFCRGSCSNAASLTVSGSHYNSIIRKLLYQGRPNNKRIDLVPCCTATHLSSIQLLYMDNNQALTQKTLPNMVVDSCGCM